MSIRQGWHSLFYKIDTEKGIYGEGNRLISKSI